MNLPKSTSTALIVSAMLSLAACGGDDADDAGVDASGGLTGAAAPNTGKAAAAFVVGPNARSVVAGLGTFSSSNLAAQGNRFVQAADGAVTTLGSFSLNDTTTVDEISGDATFAMGRWSRGRVVGGSRDLLLGGQNGRSYHYLAYNALPATAATTARTCDAGTFTAASLWDSGTVPAATTVGTTTGSAVLTWVPATATTTASASVRLTFTTTANGSSQPASYDVALTDFGAFSAVGRYLAQGPGVGVVLGDAGNGAVMVGALYRVTLPNGLTYEGLMKFKCA